MLSAECCLTLQLLPLFAGRLGTSRGMYPSTSNCPKLSSRPTSKNPAKREPEEEWRDPEDASSATPTQGVLPKLCMLFSATRDDFDYSMGRPINGDAPG